MQTDQCSAATNAALAMSDEFRRTMHEACPGAYREAPSMELKRCGCGCHADQLLDIADTARFPILAADTAEPPLPAAKSRKKARKRPEGACEHCGAPTGGRFAPGHDAKLKSELLAASHQGDAEAWAEMLLRDWARLVPADKCPDGKVMNRAGDLLAEERDGQEYNLVHRRNAARREKARTTNDPRRST